jgi:hypothetical protein
MTTIISTLQHDKNQEEKLCPKTEAARNKDVKEQRAVQQPASHSVHALK